MALAKIAFDEKGSAQDLNIVAEAGLVAAIGYLLQQDPITALDLLRTVNEASRAAKNRRIRTDLHHQVGTALFQMGEQYDDLARRHFERSMYWQERLGDIRKKSDLVITGLRKINLLDRNWDRSGGQQEIVSEVSADYPPGSLHRLMITNWGAACAFLLDNRKIHQDAMHLLDGDSQKTEWGHQATTCALLAITPELPLSPDLRSLWIRRALYENTLYRK